MIDKILNAKTLADVLDINDVDAQFRHVVKLVHPDICSDPRASDAFAKLQLLKTNFINGESFNDDAGPYKTNGYFIRFSGDKDVQKKSVEWYYRLMKIRTDATIFHKYLPASVSSVNDPAKSTPNLDATEYTLLRRGIPLSKLPVPMAQEHVNWILSRMLEFNVFLHTNNIVHGGYNLNSVFITPEDHGIQIVSFYHATLAGHKMQSVSGHYRMWYPAELFVSKKATYDIDLELAKRIAAYLLGDRSGIGTALKKTHNREFINFLLTRHDDPVEAFKQYRELLTKNFKKKFHVLNI